LVQTIYWKIYLVGIEIGGGKQGRGVYSGVTNFQEINTSGGSWKPFNPGRGHGGDFNIFS